MKAQIRTIVDLMTQVRRVEIPVFVAAGRWDQLTPNAVSQQWFNALVAPQKVWRWFENSAHFPKFEESGLFEVFLEEVALEAGAS